MKLFDSLMTYGLVTVDPLLKLVATAISGNDRQWLQNDCPRLSEFDHLFARAENYGRAQRLFVIDNNWFSPTVYGPIPDLLFSIYEVDDERLNTHYIPESSMDRPDIWRVRDRVSLRIGFNRRWPCAYAVTKMIEVLGH